MAVTGIKGSGSEVRDLQWQLFAALCQLQEYCPLDNVTLEDDSYNIDDMLDKLSQELGANE